MRSSTAGGSRSSAARARGSRNLEPSIEQIAANGVINFYAPAGEALARLEAAATTSGMGQSAVEALAGWLLVVSYWQVHLNINPQAALERGIYYLSDDPPFH